MGVTGLWRLIEPVGKPVPVETLENKVLAVDISIWLHQMVKGYQDAKGAPLPNAHLMGLFQRLCKLLYFRIKPVFVFDGAFPELKKETIGKRQDNKAKYNSESERLKREITLLLGKKTAIGALLGKQIPQKKANAVESNDDLFKLPALPAKDEESESESEEERDSSSSSIDLHSVDLQSDKFKTLPAKEKYDLLVELKETRKMNSWGKLHTLPKKSDNFSDFQMQRLLKRRKVQECLEETEKEMGEGGMSLNELESLLNEEGIDTKIESLPSRRIASNESTRFILISNVRQALEEAKKKKEQEALKQNMETSVPEKLDNVKETGEKIEEFEDDLQKAIKMSLECVDEQHTASDSTSNINEEHHKVCASTSKVIEEHCNTSGNTSKTDESWTSFLSDTNYSDTEDEDGFSQTDLSSAKAYIMQYSDFTHNAINKIVAPKQTDKSKSKESNVDEILVKLSKENSIIVGKLDLLSSDDDTLEKDKTATNSAKITNTVSNLTEKSKLMINDTNLDQTQASVMLIESNDDVISLDTSIDEIPAHLSHDKPLEYGSNNIQLDSSEDEFEEVVDSEHDSKKPVIQLTLNVNEEICNDIFADIFDRETKPLDIPKLKNISTVELTNSKDSKAKVEAELLNPSTDKMFAKKLEVETQLNSEVANKSIINIKGSIKESETCVNKNKDLNSQNVVRNLEPKQIENNVLLTEKLTSMASEIEDQENDLLQEKGRLDRIGRNITEQMTKEAQELLQLFGIPYVVAPMEAEAQCAFLESVNLTDGTITDDSDIWLFGGKTVYKNFFNQKKHVLQFLSERIEKSFNLSREQLVLLALLVGSDYTTGVTGVGPVTALEILASFPLNKRHLNETSKQARYQGVITGLLDFKKWVKAGRRTDNITLKKKLRNVNIADDFPSVRVVQAYLDPNVEKSKDKFTWGEIDITILRDYTKAKFGWSQNKLDELIKPVLKRIQDRKSQRTVHDYFKRKTEFSSLEDQMSKRVKAAVKKMETGNNFDETKEVKDKPKETRKRKHISGKNKDSGPNLNEAGPSKVRHKKDVDIKQVVKICSVNDDEATFNITIPKTQTTQEIIPQREREKQHILQNKLKAIEVFRKTNIDRKRKITKRKTLKPKDHAELSESSDSN